MRTRLSLLLLALCLTLTASVATAGTEIVAHVGVNVSTYHMDDLYSDAREKPAVGVGAAIPIAENWKLMPEVWYMNKGFKQGTLWEKIRIQVRTQTITVPVTVSYWFQAKASDPRVFAGLAVDFLLASEIARAGEDEWFDVTDQDESVYFSLVLGGGARFFGWLDVDFRYQHAFTPVTNFDYKEFDDMIPESQKFDDAFDRTWTISAGYWF